ncbi:hypothetical protein HYT25_01215 [Candidatus Pacearchaeota archaeon]|nr:hypothetical protein [Candidatus Pacearchaeota archaeon]
MDEAYRIYYLRTEENVRRFLAFARVKGYTSGNIDFTLDNLTPPMKCLSLHDPKVPLGGDMGIIRDGLLFVSTDDDFKSTRLDEIAKEFEL